MNTSFRKSCGVLVVAALLVTLAGCPRSSAAVAKEFRLENGLRITLRSVSGASETRTRCIRPGRTLSSATCGKRNSAGSFDHGVVEHRCSTQASLGLIAETASLYGGRGFGGDGGGGGHPQFADHCERSIGWGLVVLPVADAS